jgi:hypothetical protein
MPMLQTDAIKILRTGVNAFLTGEPGSGKTYTVNAYVAWLRAQGIEPAITASTGIAATHLQGLTIHSWSGIGVRESLSDADVDAIVSKEHVVRRIARTNVLIIDEVSMLSANVLAMADRVCREARRRPEPFGGMQVVLVGDFFQLPPIARGGSSASFAFDSRVWTDLNPVMCYLTEQHRQDDPSFVEVLTAIRSGEADHMTVSTILARETEADEELGDVPRLFTHNVDVDRLNQERLDQLPGPAVAHGMTGTGAPVLIDALKRGCLSPERLVLKAGAVVMGTKNLPAAGIANGTLGVVVGFERGTNNPRIETYDGRTLTVAPAEWAVEEGGKVRAKVTQVPLRLAWAITVHKSQGMSMDAAAIDLSRAFEYGQGYVALSRVRRLSGLYVLGWSEPALLVHPDVARKDAEFRRLSEDASVAFDLLDESGERLDLEKNFVRASGGTHREAGAGGALPEAAPRRAAKESTFEKSLALLKAGKDARESALDRGLTYGTICTHVEKLAQTGHLSAEEVEQAMPAELRTALPKLRDLFAQFGHAQLTPIFTKMKGKHSYDDLHLARAWFLKQEG